MGKVNFSDDFKRDAVLHITEWGYPVPLETYRLVADIDPTLKQKIFDLPQR